MKKRIIKKHLKKFGTFDSVDWKITTLIKKHNIKLNQKFNIIGIDGIFYFDVIHHAKHLYKDNVGYYDIYLKLLSEGKLRIKLCS